MTTSSLHRSKGTKYTAYISLELHWSQQNLYEVTEFSAIFLLSIEEALIEVLDLKCT